MAITPKNISWDQLICGLQQSFLNGNNKNFDTVEQLLVSYKSNREDWKRYEFFDTYRYTRNLVDDGKGLFTLVLLCWGCGQVSPVHDHSNAHCFVKQLKGSLTEYRYNWPNASNSAMEVVSEVKTQVDDVIYMSDEIGLHRVMNSSKSEGAVSLHLYTPPFQTCQIFDPETGRRTTTTPTYWSKYGLRWKDELSKNDN